MKPIEQIYKEFKDMIPKLANDYNGQKDGWPFYHSLTWGKDRKYANVYLQSSPHTELGNSIQISTSTDAELVPEIIQMLKSIEPDCEITYYEKEVKYIKKTA